VPPVVTRDGLIRHGLGLINTENDLGHYLPPARSSALLFLVHADIEGPMSKPERGPSQKS
jgi:hypothetical protein